jgi:hypothetical protein
MFGGNNLTRKAGIFLVTLLVAQVVSTGCNNSDATASAEEEANFKTHKAPIPANFNTKPGKYGAFVGESHAIQIGGTKGPDGSKAGAGGTTGSIGAAKTGADK